MAIDKVETMPNNWCVSIKDFRANYDGNKIYVGRSNNLERHVYVNLVFIFNSLSHQKEFFDWWKDKTDSGGRPFYAELDLYGERKYYLLVQSKPFSQSIATGHKITAAFVLYRNKTKDEVVAPVAHDVSATVEESSKNNVISLDAVDPDKSGILTYEFVGSHIGAVINGASITYTPSPSFTGDKSFRYKAYDGVMWSNVADIHVTVAEVGAPIAPYQEIEVAKTTNGSSARYFQLNAYDPDGKPLTYTITSKGTADAVVMAADTNPEKYNWVHLSISNGQSSVNFKYKVSNGVKTSAKGTVKVNLVTKKPYAPTIVPPSYVKMPSTYAKNVKFTIFDSPSPSYDAINGTAVQYIHKTNTALPSNISKVEILKYAGTHPVSVLQRSSLVVYTKGGMGFGKFDFGYSITNTIDVTPLKTEVEVMNIQYNKRYLSVPPTSALFIPDNGLNSGLKMGLMSQEPMGYPQASDFPDVSWEQPDPVEVGDAATYGDIFTDFSGITTKGGSDTISNPNKNGIITLTSSSSVGTLGYWIKTGVGSWNTSKITTNFRIKN